MATIYIRISDGRFYAKNLHTGAVFDEPSAIVTTHDAQGRKMLLAVGSNAANMTLEDGLKRIFPFDSHPRVVVDDFEAGETIFKYAIRAVRGRSIFAPHVVLHVTRNLTGGITPVELKALMEMAQSAGARKVNHTTNEAIGSLSQGEVEEGLKRTFS